MAWDDHYQGMLDQGVFTQVAWNRADDLADEVVRERARAERAEIEARKSALDRDLAQIRLAAREKTIVGINESHEKTIVGINESHEKTIVRLNESRAIHKEIDKKFTEVVEAQLNLSNTYNEALSRSYSEMGRQMDNTIATLRSVLRKRPELVQWMWLNGLNCELSGEKTRDEIYSANLSEVKNGTPRHEGMGEPDYLNKIYDRMADSYRVIFDLTTNE